MRFNLAMIFRVSSFRSWALILVLVAFGGCASKLPKIGEGEDGSWVAQLTYSGSISDSSAPGPPLKLKNKDLAPYLEIERIQGLLTVKGPNTHRKLIESLARHGGETLEETKRELGIESELKIDIVLLPIAGEEWPSLFEFEFKAPSNKLIHPLPVEPEICSLPDFLRGNGPTSIDGLTDGIMGHEYFEFSLMTEEGNMGIAPDWKFKMENGFTFRKRGHTRWFRDGFATYAAMVWLEKLYDRIGIPATDRDKVVFIDKAEESLKNNGGRIFRWTQFKPDETQPLYEASLGLFLKLEEEFGRDLIREWNEAIAASEEEFRDRAVLLKTAKGVFGVDLRKFARQAGK